MYQFRFSGNALLDLEIAELIATVDASMFVLDFLPNATVEQMKERAEKFYSIVRSKHPETPILFVEDPIFTHSRFDKRVAREVKAKNETIAAIFQSMKKRVKRTSIFFLQRISSGTMVRLLLMVFILQIWALCAMRKYYIR